jgi:hypothetical protein
MELESDKAQSLINREVIDYVAQSDILPFCVYHLSSQPPRGYISGPQISSNGKLYCPEPPPDSAYGPWKLAFSFYAINPNIRPLPYGTELFCSHTAQSYPYDTTSVQYLYDPYDLQKNCVYFIAYTKPVPWSMPLFLHNSGSSVYPSKHSSSPFETQTGSGSSEFTYNPRHWGGTGHINPVYVLSPELFGPNYQEIKFVCNIATCLPFLPKHAKDVQAFRFEKNLDFTIDGGVPKPTSLSECITRCNELIPRDETIGTPLNLIDIIHRELGSSSSPSVSLSAETVVSKTDSILDKTILISIGIIVVLTSLVVIGMISYRAIDK